MNANTQPLAGSSRTNAAHCDDAEDPLIELTPHGLKADLRHHDQPLPAPGQ